MSDDRFDIDGSRFVERASARVAEALIAAPVRRGHFVLRFHGAPRGVEARRRQPFRQHRLTHPDGGVERRLERHGEPIDGPLWALHDGAELVLLRLILVIGLNQRHESGRESRLAHAYKLHGDAVASEDRHDRLRRDRFGRAVDV